ncbi:DUF4873 domain-containing protein [Paractinoplanes bogorensis]|uniref:DUF4873 domain-containing protein n=1 Tax=Paractinoplanes bogorensis TaxID=1610840 RepID=UPI0027E0A93A|nr:DUF4873 domain-containing protein [Actinoplanes bogorensis]
MDDIGDEEYRGAAVLVIGDDRHAVEVRMWARFEPIEGRFRWAGRTSPDPVLSELVTGGTRAASLTIAERAAADVRLSEPDPWGGVRLSGTGTPPWFPLAETATPR